MDNALEAAVTSSDVAPIKVEVTNTDDFREDLAQRIIAGVAVTVAIGITKIVIDVVNEKRKQKKAEKAADKPKLEQIK